MKKNKGIIGKILIGIVIAVAVFYFVLLLTR